MSPLDSLKRTFEGFLQDKSAGKPEVSRDATDAIAPADPASTVAAQPEEPNDVSQCRQFLGKRAEAGNP
jgi:hypothetical protein